MTKHQIFTDSQIRLPRDASSGAFVSIVVTEGFSLLSLASLTDALGVVQSASAVHRVRVRIFSVSGQSVQAGAGGLILPDEPLETDGVYARSLAQSDTVILCSGPHMTAPDRNAAMKLVRWCRRSSVPVCLMGGAVRTAAAAGFLTTGTDHWSRIPVNAETLPDVSFRNALFIADGNLVTCCGELGALDFALHWISVNISPAVSARVRTHLVVASSRSADREQTCSVTDIHKGMPRQLQAIIAAMQKMLEDAGHSDDSLNIAELADQAALSTRQVERLFARYLSTSPVKFYRSKQFEKARSLIEDTDMSITEIALACGFSSISAFGRGFRRHFDIAPAKLRAHQQLVL